MAFTLYRDPESSTKAYLDDGERVYALTYFCNVDEVYVTLLGPDEAEEVRSANLDVVDKVNGVPLNEIGPRVRELMGWKPCMRPQ